MTAGFAQYDGIAYFDRSSNVVLNEKEFAGTTYIIQKNIINWVLSKDTLKIDKYICYKATTTTTTTTTIVNSEGTHHLEVIAWYVPKISLSYGPDGFGGLPGLILQLENNGVITTLKKIEFSKKKSLKILEPSRGVKITQEKFDNIVSNIYENRKKKLIKFVQNKF
jgi:GLPGLI family protein